MFTSFTFFSFFFYCSAHHRDLHSFPTRRSSDLNLRPANLGDLSLIVPAHAAMAREESGVDPLQVDREGFRSRCRRRDRKSTRLNSSHVAISYAVFCLKKKIESPQQFALRLLGGI